MFSTVALLCFLFALVYLIHSRYKIMSIRGKMGLTGPPTNLLFGNAVEIALYTMRHGPKMAEILQKWSEKYGTIFGFYMGPLYFVMISDLELVKEVLIGKFNCFTDRMNMYMIRKSLEDSLITLHGKNWRQVRQAVSPTFSKSKTKQMSHTILEKLDIFMKIIENHSKNGAEFDIHKHFKALSLDVIGKVAFAMDVDCQRNQDDPFLVNVSTFFKEMPAPENSHIFKLAALFPELESVLNALLGLTASVKAENWIFKNLQNVIAHRVDNQEFKSIDILQVLLDKSTLLNNYNNNSEKTTAFTLTPDQIASNCFVFLLGGYETTSTAMGFSAWLLAKHKNVQDKLRKELDDTFERQEDITYEKVLKLPYLDAVYHECLRLYPPVIMFVSRTCTQECYIGETKFSPGIQVMIPIYTIHRDPEIWPEPEKFIPERFYENRDFHPMSWLPFGSGPRNCIGVRFAEMEYKLTFARLLLGFDLNFSSNSQDPLPIINHHALLDPQQVTLKVSRRAGIGGGS